MSFLNRAEKLEADGGGSVIKFSRIRDAIVARFIGRDTVRTKMGEGKRLRVEIVETNIEGVEPGPAVIFESGHISQIMEKNKLTLGQGFMLKLCDIDRKSRFKRFGFDRLTEIDACSPPNDDGGNPPEWLLNSGEPPDEEEPGSDSDLGRDNFVRNT